MKRIQDARVSSSYVEVLLEDGSWGCVPHHGMELLDWNQGALLFRDRYGISVIDGSGESIGSIQFSGDFDQARAIGDTVVVTDHQYSYTYSRRGDLIRTRPR